MLRTAEPKLTTHSVSPAQGELSGESISFVGQNFEVTRYAAAVAHVRKARCVLRGLEQKFFLRAELLCLAVSDQRIRDTAERALYCLLVEKQRSLLLGFREAHVGTEFSRRENRLCQ